MAIHTYIAIYNYKLYIDRLQYTGTPQNIGHWPESSTDVIKLIQHSHAAVQVCPGSSQATLHVCLGLERGFGLGGNNPFGFQMEQIINQIVDCKYMVIY